MGPFNAFLIIQGLEALPLRIGAICVNVAQVAEYLAKHENVERMIFPGLMRGEARRRADAYLRGGYGGLLGFEHEDDILDDLAQALEAV